MISRTIRNGVLTGVLLTAAAVMPGKPVMAQEQCQTAECAACVEYYMGIWQQCFNECVVNTGGSDCFTPCAHIVSFAYNFCVLSHGWG
jgi:hypothetical protein